MSHMGHWEGPGPGHFDEPRIGGVSVFKGQVLLQPSSTLTASFPLPRFPIARNNSRTLTESSLALFPVPVSVASI